MCKTNRDHKNTYLSKLVLQAVVVSQINFACLQNWSSDEQKSGKDVRSYFLIQILLNSQKPFRVSSTNSHLLSSTVWGVYLFCTLRGKGAQQKKEAWEK